jgi:hypothetical protein
MLRALIRAGALAIALFPLRGWSCACGCGIFDVGTSEMFPTGANVMTYLETDYQDQNRNWDGTAPAPAADNPDKDLRTTFLTAGLQQMFDRSWGLQVDVPYVMRHFQTTGGASGGDLVTFDWAGLGDIRLEGIYTGFSPDLSTGITAGVKMPTGDYTHNDVYGDVDRDSEFGTGSTDLLLGAFHRGALAGLGDWTWFAQAALDLPILARDQYRPGLEVDSVLGLYHAGWAFGRWRLTPMAQLKGAARASDRGINAAVPLASGYDRLLAAPGLEFTLHPVTIYADIELPVYQRFTGDQLSARALGKISVSCHF